MKSFSGPISIKTYMYKLITTIMWIEANLIRKTEKIALVNILKRLANGYLDSEEDS